MPITPFIGVRISEVLRGLSELSGRHRCTGFLAEVPAAEYFANDFMCDECAVKSERYPLAATPGSSMVPPENDRGGST